MTLLHERLIAVPLPIRLNCPHLFDAPCEIAHARRTLDELCVAGVCTIVDPTTFELGRDVALLRRGAEGTRMQIVVTTEVHLQVPGFFRRRTPDPIVELLLRDIEGGIAKTGIKVATERGDRRASAPAPRRRGHSRGPHPCPAACTHARTLLLDLTMI